MTTNRNQTFCTECGGWWDESDVQVVGTWNVCPVCNALVAKITDGEAG